MFYLSVVFLVIAFAEIKNSTDNHCITPHESLINRSVPEILVLANDIELNPGPRAPKYPCGVCQKAVTWKHKAICCDTCNTWFHTQCESIRDTIYDTMQNSNTSWNCLKCGMPNLSSTLFNYDDIEHSENIYQHISNSNDNSIQLPSTPAGLGPPLHTSSPSNQRKQHSYTHIPKTKNPLRIINLNCQSLKKTIKPNFYHSLIVQNQT